MSSAEVPACRAIAVAVPARTRRVVDDPAPPASPSTRAAASRPPRNATPPEAHMGMLIPKAVTTVTAK